jgi:hypothetical protein
MPAPPPPFSRFVAIDWSGARSLSYQRRAIVRCVVEGREGHRRVASLEAGRERQEIVTWLAECAADRVPTLVGLDFPFAYAAPFLDHVGAPDFSALLTRMAPLDGVSAATDRVDAFIAGCGQWWACWGRDEEARWTRRRVERLRELRGAASPLEARLRDGKYRFEGQRQVGKAAITGIAAIADLKSREPGVRVWPFEDPAGATLVLAEIWPRLALGTVRKNERAARRRHVRELRRAGVRLRPEHERLAVASDHAIDALAAAAEMASGRWPLAPRSALPPESLREGWILGVEPTSIAPGGHRAEGRSARDQPEGSPVGQAQ